MRATNVSQVPQRGLLRYPGGKTWLVPVARRWLRFGSRPRLLLEPFAGGAAVGLAAAFEDLAAEVRLVELDPDVAALWRVALGDDASWLAGQIAGFEPTRESVTTLLAGEPASDRERAFHVLVKNRTHYGGVLAPGSAMVRGGEDGRGLRSRWYPETLARRLRDLEAVKGKLSCARGDGIAATEALSSDPGARFFVDPPYTAAGKRAGARLYAHHQLDHERLFDVLAGLRGDFLATYDDNPGVREMAARRGFACATVPMKSGHHAVAEELLISRDLSWLKE